MAERETGTVKVRFFSIVLPSWFRSDQTLEMEREGVWIYPARWHG